MAKLFNLVKVNIATTGTGDVTFGSAFSGAFFTPSEVGAADGDSVSYVLVEGDDTEIGTGVIGGSVTTMTRTVLKSKIGGVAGTTKMTLGGTAWLAFTALDRDILNPANNLSDLTSAPTSLTNLGAVGAIRIQTFTASGTYTPDPKLIFAVIEGVGGGGGGGGAVGTASHAYTGAGGNSAGRSIVFTDVATIGASQSVTIGGGGGGGAGATNGSDGGDTSVGTLPLLLAKGGKGGKYSSNAQVPTSVAPSALGTGDIVELGNPGSPGLYATAITVVFPSGNGASSIFGGGAPGVNGSGAGTNGVNATGYGSGGSGAGVYNGTASATGGAGKAGFVKVIEYCSE